MTRLAVIFVQLLVVPAAALQIGAAPRTPLPAVRCSQIVAQLAMPETKTKQRVSTGDPGGGGGKGGGSPSLQIAQPKRKVESEDCPLWKVILLGDEDYESDPVRARSRRRNTSVCSAD